MSKNFDSPIEIGFCGSTPERGENVTLPETKKLNQYGFTTVEWHEVVEQASELHDGLMKAEGDWDQESHVIIQCLVKRKQELLAALKENARLKLAFGLVLKLHGCGGENCTEAAYLKDAGEMIELLGVFKATLSLRGEEIARLEKALRSCRSNYAGYAITSPNPYQNAIAVVQDFWDHISGVDKKIDAELARLKGGE